MADRIVVRRGSCSPESAAAASRDAFARMANEGAMPELALLTFTTSGVLRSPLLAASDRESDVFVRASCGADAHVSRGVLHVMLALPRLDALEDVRVDVILNRAVRPLLRAISRSGALAHFFGRDWISASHRPVALLGFAHEARTQRTLVEAFVSVTESACGDARASYMGKEPATLASLASYEIDVRDVAESVERAVLDAYGLSPDARNVDDDELRALSQSPSPAPPRPARFAASLDEAIGPVCIGRGGAGELRFGGELMVSFDALETLESSLASTNLDDRSAVAKAVQSALAPPGVALFGVRSLDSFVRLATELRGAS